MSAPVGDLPPGMQDVTVSDVWRGWFYCLEFRTPDGASAQPAPAPASIGADMPSDHHPHPDAPAGPA